ncbi:MAG: saccharopine dehydrogenase family protein [Polyangiales bacterium]
MTALLYGAYGYTGELTARLAKERGVPLILAGRDATKTREIAARCGMEHRVFGLDDPRALDDGLAGVSVVLHCAGPFARTSKPMVDACLRNAVHYLDITGEIDVFEACRMRDTEAQKAGVMLLPGSGFDVVPSDCLAAHVAEQVPRATHLVLAFMSLGSMSHGTALTTVENLHRGGRVRRDCEIVNVPVGALSRDIEYLPGQTKPSMAIPWGDVSTAYFSTRIPNIEVYVPAPAPMRFGARAMGMLGGIVGSKPVQSALKKMVERRPAGPSDEQRARGGSFLYAEAWSDDRRAVARLKTPDGYTLTADASLAIVERVLRGEAKPGYQTPSTAFGADFVLTLPGVTRT